MVKKNSKSPYNEFLKELLGAVFPGAFLLFSLVFIFFGPVIILDLLIGRPTENIVGFLKNGNTFLQYSGYISTFSVLIIFLIFSFVFGSIYYRRTCDLPNQQSIYKLLSKDYRFLSLINQKRRLFSRNGLRIRICDYINSNNDSTKDIDKYIRNNYAINGLEAIGIIRVDFLIRNQKKLRSNVNEPKDYIYKPTNYCDDNCHLHKDCKKSSIEKPKGIFYQEKYIIGKKKISVHYPFTCISEYLKSHGYEDLADKVRCPDKSNVRNYINEIKIQKRNEHSAIKELDKIEAHIRYSSSMWYISKSVIKLANIILGVFAFIKKGIH